MPKKRRCFRISGSGRLHPEPERLLIALIAKYMTQFRKHIKDPLYRNALFLMASSVVAAGLGFFFWMVVARLYTETDVGFGAATISAMSLLAALSRLGFGFTIIRFLPKAEAPKEMINSCFTLSGIVSLALAAIFIIGLDFWSPALAFIKNNLIFASAFAIFVLIYTLQGLMAEVFVARRRAEFNLSMNAIFSLLKIPLPLVLVSFFYTFGIVSSWGIASAVALAISAFWFVPRILAGYKPLPKLNWGILKEFRGYSAGNYITSVLQMAPSLVLPLIIVNLLGPAQNAYFYVGWSIASLLFIIPTAVSQSLLAEGSHFEDRLHIDVGRSLKFTFLILIPTIILVCLLGKWLLLLFGESYSANALVMLWVLGASGVFIGFNSIYQSILRVEGRIRELVCLSVFTTAAVLIGSYLVAPTFGIVGVAYIWLGVQGVVSLYVIQAMRSRIRPWD